MGYRGYRDIGCYFVAMKQAAFINSITGVKLCMRDKVGENVADMIFLSKCGDELDLCSSIHFNV